MRCLICGENKVKSSTHNGMSEEDAIFLIEKIGPEKDHQPKNQYTQKVSTADNRMWNDGIVQIISAGYGSKHDTDQFVMAICDECINEKQDQGLLLYYGNYMNPGEYDKEQIAKSRIRYRRDSNLDNLV